MAVKIGKCGLVIFDKPKKYNLLKLISWIGTFFSILGAFLVANKIFLLGFSVFAVGAVLWMIVAKLQHNAAMFFLELVFLIANINGIINYI